MTGPVYRADPADARVAVKLEALVALFHIPSGTTHMLVSPAPEILDALAQGPADADTVLARLRTAYDVEAPDMIGAVGARLTELEASGLVSRA